MTIQGSASQAFSVALKQAIELSKRYYLAFIIPVLLGLLWGIVSRAFLYGGMSALMSSLMVKSPGMDMIVRLRHLVLVLILTMAISVLLWMVALAGAGQALKHRNEEFNLSFDEVLSYTGDRLGPLVTGGIVYIFLPAVPAMIPVVGFVYMIGFLIYILFIGKNYGGFFFWAYPVIAEGKSASEGFQAAKAAALSKKGPFWTALVMAFVATWIINLFLGFMPYIGFIFVWALNLVLLIYAGILYYDYQGNTGEQPIPPPVS